MLMRLSIIARCILKIKYFFKKSGKNQENPAAFLVTSSFCHGFHTMAKPQVFIALRSGRFLNASFRPFAEDLLPIITVPKPQNGR